MTGKFFRVLWVSLAAFLAALASLVLLLILALYAYPKLRPVTGNAVTEFSTDVALSGVTVYNPGEAPLAMQTVLVSGGVISAIQPVDAPIPADYTILDRRGQWLLPGLVDLHVHVFDESDLALLLAHGVTTARNMMGMPVHLRMRSALESGRLSGPRLIAGSPTMNSPEDAYPTHQSVATPDQARNAVRSAVAAGYDLLKIYDGVSEGVFRALVDEARSLDFPVAGHIPESVPFDEVLAAYVSIEHIEELDQAVLHGDEAMLPAMVQQLAAAGVPVVTTLQAFQAVADACGKGSTYVEARLTPRINPLMGLMSRGALDYWSAQNAATCADLAARSARFARITLALFDAGIPLVLGTDAGPSLTEPGTSITDEIRLLKQAGLPTEAILQAATSAAATVLQGELGEQAVGRIAAGWSADALLLPGDPRVDLSLLENPLAILCRGRLYQADGIAALKRRAEQHAGLLLSAGRLLESIVQ